MSTEALHIKKCENFTVTAKIFLILCIIRKYIKL